MHEIYDSITLLSPMVNNSELREFQKSAPSYLPSMSKSSPDDVPKFGSNMKFLLAGVEKGIE